MATGAYPGSDYYPVKPTKNTTYKVVFGGYTDPVQTQYSDNYAPSESATFTVQVARKITYPSSGFVLKGKVTPDYGKKKIVIKVSKKQNKGYKKFKTIKTDKRRQVQDHPAAPRRHLVLELRRQGRRQVPRQRLRLEDLHRLT